MMQCDRRRFLQMCGGLLAGAVWPQAAPATASSKQPPNIIFILADDMSWGDLGYTGQWQFATPNLDRLARAGTRFTQAHSASPECAPSRAGLMTGRHMGHCRIRCNASARGQDHLLAGDVTVAEVLKQAGYATGMVGKWGIGLPGTEGVPYRQGFDFSFGFYDQTRAHGYYPDFIEENEKVIDLPENHGFNMQRVYQSTSKQIECANRYDARGRLVPDGVADPAKAKNSQALIHQAGLDFIRRSKDQPFFLYYATQLPHGPLIVPELGEFKDKGWSLKHKEWAAMVTWLDRCAGEIVALLKDLKLEDDTIVFFASDNGYSEWGYFARKRWEDDPLFKNKGPWPGGKFALYEGGCRVPFFAWWPGHIPARQSDHVLALYDFLATAAELAGAAPPPTDGISFAPELLGNPAAQKKHEHLYWEGGSQLPHGQAARFGPWYAMREHPDKPIHVFDVVRDPGCAKDCAADLPELVTRAQAIFAQEHIDSEWYRNPGESNTSFKAKQDRAHREGTLQPTTPANRPVSGRAAAGSGTNISKKRKGRP